VWWTVAEDKDSSLPRFRFWFAFVWITYDFFDLISHGTADILWTTSASDGPLRALQAALIVGQLCILLGISAPLACVVCFFLRLAEAQFYFGLNDYYYYCVMILPLTFAGEKRLWTRKLLLLQIAWIYFATATLKLNQDWLSGGHLYVRQNYLAAIQGWPYPAWYRALFLSLSGCRWLAVLGVAAEFVLAGMVLSRRFPRACTALAVSVHLFAALALNVWFFGASMALGVALLV
jgi:hypothetical protein